MEFNSLRERIKKCDTCDIKGKHSAPLYFQCKLPHKVKVLVISEQPKETDSVITENTVKKNLKKELNASETIIKIANIFSEEFTDSILKESGSFYWTHHTKCPSSKKNSISKICPNKWLIEELEVFSNVKFIVSIGSEAHSVIMKLSGNKITFADVLWDQFELIIKEEGIRELLNIRILNKEYKYILLPHPNGSNPLNIFIPKLKNLIRKMEQDLPNNHVKNNTKEISKTENGGL